MINRITLAALIFLQGSTFCQAANEPLVGKWQLDQQEINDEKIPTDLPLTLTITKSGEKLGFAFSVPVNNVDVVSMTYEVKLDGSEADVKDGKGEKVGTVEMSADGPSRYSLTLKRPNRPDSMGHLTVSADGKTLTSESDMRRGAKALHSKQVFKRQ